MRRASRFPRQRSMPRRPPTPCCSLLWADRKWDTTDPNAPRPEQGLLGIRKGLGLYTNLRPVQIFDALAGASTLKPEVIAGVDLMIVRELTGGLYFGKRERFYDEEGAGTNGAKGQRAVTTRSSIASADDRAHRAPGVRGSAQR